jgi:tetratricopeptide (TPR) repeat protein
MRRSRCSSCSTSLPITKMYVVGGKLLCEPCGTRRVGKVRAAEQEITIERALDPTICAECGADRGETEWLKVGGNPLCFKCRQRFYQVPYPAWVLLVVAALFALAGYALWHGYAYFETGQALVEGERHLEEGQYAVAAAELRRVLAAGSESDRVLLEAAKAYLLAGDYEHARLLLNGHPRFEETGALFAEVQKVWERAVKANDLADEARKAARAGDYTLAAGKMRDAAALYPEMPSLAEDAKTLATQALAQNVVPPEGKPAAQ